MRKIETNEKSIKTRPDQTRPIKWDQPNETRPDHVLEHAIDMDYSRKWLGFEKYKLSIIGKTNFSYR